MESLQNVHDCPPQQVEPLPHSQAAGRKPTVVLASQSPSWVARGKPGQTLLQDRGGVCILE